MLALVSVSEWPLRFETATPWLSSFVHATGVSSCGVERAWRVREGGGRAGVKKSGGRRGAHHLDTRWDQQHVQMNAPDAARPCGVGARRRAGTRVRAKWGNNIFAKLAT